MSGADRAAATLELRAARLDDARWLNGLRTHPATAEYLAVSREDEAELRAELAAAGDRAGWLVAEGGAQQLAALRWTLVNRRSRIAELSHVVVDPDRRRQGIGAATVRAAAQLLVETHDIHRVQLEVYGDNRHSAPSHVQGSGGRGSAARPTGAAALGRTASCTGCSPRSFRERPQAVGKR